MNDHMQPSILCGVFAVALVAASARSGHGGPVAWWRFDNADKPGLDSVSGVEDTVGGRFRSVPGVSGQALKLDGFTAFLARKPDGVPKLRGGLTLEAWLALGAYPWSWCPIVDLHRKPVNGIFFGIDADGTFKLQLAAGGRWQEAVSKAPLPLRQWAHVAGVYDPRKGITVYLNGKPVGSTAAQGAFRPADGLDLLIGRHRYPYPPAGTMAPGSKAQWHTHLDGLIDEVKIHNRALSADEITQACAKAKPQKPPDLPPRVLPAGPKGPGPFGAYYTKLKFYEEWDALWRVGDYADVLVRFDLAPYRLVCWRGAGYVPCWVTENGIWYANEWTETIDPPHTSIACEPIADPQARWSHVRIIESGDARAVIHWRYALVDMNYIFAHVDPETGWSDWCDEIYTIYPDGVGVRKATLHTSQPQKWHEWQESIIVLGPGMRPEDAIEKHPVTLVNMKGQTHTYAWEHKGRRVIDQPEGANIELVHLKSKAKPFLVVSPEPCAASPKGPLFHMWGGGGANSFFHWWNHWPAHPMPSNIRNAVAADRPGHSTVTNVDWKEHRVAPPSYTRVMLHGLTERPAAELAVLARSWLNAPRLELLADGFTSQGYDPTERAYGLTSRSPDRPATLRFNLAASEDRPALNPAFIILRWGRADATVKINGHTLQRGKTFRLAHRRRLEGTDLILWIQRESLSPVSVSVEPVGR